MLYYSQHSINIKCTSWKRKFGIFCFVYLPAAVLCIPNMPRKQPSSILHLELDLDRTKVAIIIYFIPRKLGILCVPLADLINGGTFSTTKYPHEHIVRSILCCCLNKKTFFYNKKLCIVGNPQFAIDKLNKKIIRVMIKDKQWSI